MIAGLLDPVQKDLYRRISKLGNMGPVDHALIRPSRKAKSDSPVLRTSTLTPHSQLS